MEYLSCAPYKVNATENRIPSAAIANSATRQPGNLEDRNKADEQIADWQLAIHE